MQTWQLQDAKNRLSEVLRHAHQEPQLITLRGKEEAVVLSFDEYQKLVQPKKTWAELLGEVAQAGIELDFARSRDTGRNIAGSKFSAPGKIRSWVSAVDCRNV